VSDTNHHLKENTHGFWCGQCQANFRSEVAHAQYLQNQITAENATVPGPPGPCRDHRPIVTRWDHEYDENPPSDRTGAVLVNIARTATEAWCPNCGRIERIPTYKEQNQ
jgi:predicted RNA-binding Zn-ribbon protein involved in translation (DUF1610 family)